MTKQKTWKVDEIAAAPLVCRGTSRPGDDGSRVFLGCGLDLRAHLASMLTDGTAKADGVRVLYDCPQCGAPHSFSRTPA